MPWNTAIPILVWAAIIIPLTIVYFIVKVKDRITPFLLIIDYLLINLYFALVVNFSMLVYWLRFVPVIMLIPICFHLFDRWIRKSAVPAKGLPRIIVWIALAILPVVAFIDWQALKSYSFPESPIAPVLVQHPVQTGMYVIVNGGNGLDGVGMNDRVNDWLGRPIANSDPSQAYGVDIVEITSRGMLAEKFFSKNRNEYEGWEEPVYAPCPGEIVAFETGHPDRVPLSPSEGYSPGNYVVIKCVDYYITLSNLRDGFTPVAVGERVSMSRIVGYMGSSGTPAMVFLHMHATSGSWGPDGIPVPIKFENGYNFIYHVRNGLYVR